MLQTQIQQFGYKLHNPDSTLSFVLVRTRQIYVRLPVFADAKQRSESLLNTRPPLQICPHLARHITHAISTGHVVFTLGGGRSTTSPCVGYDAYQ
jgi:hypothetical protein